MRKVVLIVCSLFVVATFASFGCPTTGLSDTVRQAILGRHNSFRSQLAQGQSVMKDGGKAASAKNMYKLKYDCGVEATAQAWADQCLFTHSNMAFRNAGENLFYMSVPNYNPKISVIQASKYWWKELSELGGISSTNVTLTMAAFNTGIGHWSQMAWAKSTLIGCGYKSCPRMTLVVCHYKTAGNYINEPIYEIGNPCIVDSDCTTYPNSKCDFKTKLCYI